MKRIHLNPLVILTGVFLAFVFSVSAIYTYNCIYSARVCKAIHEGNTQKALQIIECPGNVNTYSRPLVFHRIYTLLDFYHGAELPLVEACGEGNYEVVAALLKKGADPNKHYKGYWSPIENTFAQRKTECIEIAELLIQYGACVDLHGSSMTALFHTIFDYKFRRISEKDADFLYDAVTLLLDNGASAYHNGEYCVTHFLSTMGNVELLDCIATKYRLPLDCKTSDGETPLMWALKSKESQPVDMVAYLLEAGADVCAANNKGKSVLEYAKENGNIDIISVISALVM